MKTVVFDCEKVKVVGVYDSLSTANTMATYYTTKNGVDADSIDIIPSENFNWDWYNNQ